MPDDPSHQRVRSQPGRRTTTGSIPVSRRRRTMFAGFLRAQSPRPRSSLQFGVARPADGKTQFLWTSYEQSAGAGVAFTGTRISDTFLLAHRGHFLRV
jgi:hypothetical protein